MSAPKLSVQAQAGQAAAQILGRVNSTLTSINNVLTNGIPAMPAAGPNPGQDAISAADLRTALGDAAVVKLQAIVTAWNA